MTTLRLETLKDQPAEHPVPEANLELTQVTVRVRRLQRLGLRRLSRGHLELSRRPGLCAQSAEAFGRVRTALGKALRVNVSGTARLLEASWGADRVLSRACVFALVDFTSVGSGAVLEVEKGFLTAILGHLSGEAPASPAPVMALTRIEEAAFGYLLLAGLQALRAEPSIEGRLSPRLQSVTADELAAREHLDAGPQVLLEMQLEVGGVSGVVRVALSAEALQLFALQAPCSPSPTPQPQWLAAQVDLACILPGSPLPSEDMDALRAGDVVLLEGPRLREGELLGACRLEALGFELQGELAADGFRHRMAVATPLPPENPMHPLTAVETPLLPVNVEVELTRLQLPLAELVSLQPGRVVPLHINAMEPVLLRVGDRRVARAELVDIDGQVGARILALLP